MSLKEFFVDRFCQKGLTDSSTKVQTFGPTQNGRLIVVFNPSRDTVD